MIKGALVQLVDSLSTQLPNLVVFQFNPETMQHSYAQGSGAVATGATATAGNPLAVSGPPSETFSFTLQMDTTDTFYPPSNPIGAALVANGLYNRLSALELFLYPTPITDLLGGGGSARTTPAAVLPTALFVWGLGRILPVRVTSLSITEKLFDERLNPTHADAQISLKVLTADDLRSVTGLSGELATAAYKFTAGLRLARAALNLGTSAADVISTVMTAMQPPL